MKPGARRGLVLTVAVLAAALAQAVYADAMRIHDARPDFLTAVAIVGALFCNANEGAGLGFSAGLLYACLASPPGSGFGSLIVSRTLVGFGVGWLEERVFRDNPFIALALVASGTALAEVLLFIFAPQPNVPHWAHALGQTTLYNSALALPLYYFLHRFLGMRRDKSRLSQIKRGQA